MNGAKILVRDQDDWFEKMSADVILGKRVYFYL